MSKLKRIISIGFTFILMLCMSICFVGCKKEKQGELEYRLSDCETYYAVSGCNDDVTEVLIPFTYNGLPVKEIADNAFQDKIRIERVLISDNITKIGNRAFSGCNTLRTVIIPHSVVEIGRAVFYGCWRLESVDLPKSLEIIPERAFEGCHSLMTLTMFDEVTEIEAWAFSDCYRLNEVELSANLEKLGEGAFAGCRRLAKIALPEGVTIIEPKTFFECICLSAVESTQDVKVIKESAFEGCDLTTLFCIDNVQRIEKRAFAYNCNLRECFLDGKLTCIGEEAFWCCGCLGFEFDVFIYRNVAEIGKHAFGGVNDLHVQPYFEIGIFIQAWEKPSGWSEEWLHEATPHTVHYW